ncbi:hypothetical protein M0811_06639 [Anaeramoeba ignava]|uniref:Uncharacterized protein n=1 Tax=Anaeramoeba ignava TaxID=1746090 RepID=A0A9Q0RD48_ANAIG|nr:hypothetical protein M0811_06639 [Anaeramoeba ignava]
MEKEYIEKYDQLIQFFFNITTNQFTQIKKELNQERLMTQIIGHWFENDFTFQVCFDC